MASYIPYPQIYIRNPKDIFLANYIDISKRISKLVLKKLQVSFKGRCIKQKKEVV